LSLQQTHEHIKIALPLLERALQTPISLGPSNTHSLEEFCTTDDSEFRRTCQDLFAMLIHNHYHVEQFPQARYYLNKYDHPRSTTRKFMKPELVHRQIQGLRAQPWWDPSELASLMPVLLNIQTQYVTIRDEVLMTTSLNSMWGPNQDVRLSTNAGTSLLLHPAPPLPYPSLPCPYTHPSSHHSYQSGIPPPPGTPSH
jgi:hypothetical protein